MFTEFFYQVQDYLVYCKMKGLADKTLKSYEQSLGLFVRYCEEHKSFLYLLHGFPNCQKESY